MSPDRYAGEVYDPASLPPYCYAVSNPVNFIDPSGNSALIEYTVNFFGTVGRAVTPVVKFGLEVAWHKRSGRPGGSNSLSPTNKINCLQYLISTFGYDPGAPATKGACLLSVRREYGCSELHEIICSHMSFGRDSGRCGC